ncbi:unnamed protein product, partial [Porites lobata]
ENDKVQRGAVAMMMIARAKEALTEWMPINKRIITARFYSKYKKLTVVKAYAPTNDAMDKENNELYNLLPDTDTISDCNRNDVIVVMGDLNAKVGNNNTNRREVMRKFGIVIMNDSGERLCDFCSANGFIITGTNFPHKDIHKLTWVSPDGRTVNQIHHVLVNENMRTSI